MDEDGDETYDWNGRDLNGDGMIGPGENEKDPNCRRPDWAVEDVPNGPCGLGLELMLLLPPLLWSHRRRRR